MDMLVSLGGRTIRIPIKPGLSGKVAIAVHRGELALAASKVQETIGLCARCGTVVDPMTGLEQAQATSGGSA